MFFGKREFLIIGIIFLIVNSVMILVLLNPDLRYGSFREDRLESLQINNDAEVSDMEWEGGLLYYQEKQLSSDSEFEVILFELNPTTNNVRMIKGFNFNIQKQYYKILEIDNGLIYIYGENQYIADISDYNLIETISVIDMEGNSISDFETPILPALTNPNREDNIIILDVLVYGDVIYIHQRLVSSLDNFRFEFYSILDKEDYSLNIVLPMIVFGISQLHVIDGTLYSIVNEFGMLKYIDLTLNDGIFDFNVDREINITNHNWFLVNNMDELILIRTIDNIGESSVSITNHDNKELDVSFYEYSFGLRTLQIGEFLDFIFITGSKGTADFSDSNSYPLFLLYQQRVNQIVEIELDIYVKNGVPGFLTQTTTSNQNFATIENYLSEESDIFESVILYSNNIFTPSIFIEEVNPILQFNGIAFLSSGIYLTFIFFKRKRSKITPSKLDFPEFN